jgi:hypothetical protein
MKQLSIAANAKHKCSVMYAGSPVGIPGPSYFGAAWNLLATRTTTKWEDVPRIFANLMGLYVSTDMQIQPHDLMKSILARQPEVPLAILFIEAERCDRDARSNSATLREDVWVPVAPHNSEMLPLPLDDRDMVQLELAGLGCDPVTYRTSCLSVLDHGILFPKDYYESQWKMYEVHTSRIDDWRFRAGEATFWISLRDPKPRPLRHSMHRILVVLDLTNERDSRYDTRSSTRQKGCLLLVTGEEGRTLHTIYLCPIYWGTCDDSTAPEVAHSCTMVGELVDIGSGDIVMDSGTSPRVVVSCAEH